ncbi:hypothetical protein NQ314_015299 [Rhamnusium bicolor]|uniref:Uncharacterized protein n=1 Tax=Rhamnusium bicolor TaxID=1586634 RepID=A0AAV8WZT2_9CUCU|nr:hypothetical protein NQ314_015299 [Rhamnusium bicolor]
MSPFENDEIETNSTASAAQRFVSIKRPNENSLPTEHEKKLKINQRSTPEKVRDINVDESGAAILQDTFDTIDVSKLLHKDDIKPSPSMEKSEFDAFASYLNKNCTPKPTSRRLFNNKVKSTTENNSQKDQVTKDKSALSQFFNTQVIAQIDTAFNLGDKGTSIFEEKKRQVKMKIIRTLKIVQEITTMMHLEYRFYIVSEKS